MTLLIIGLILFLGVHSVRIVADDWRSAQLARLGEKGWKGLYSLVSLAGLVLIVWGYGQARMTPVDLWSPPLWTRHLASLLTLLSFILIAAAYVPRNHLKQRIGHPMLAGVKLWALAHLLANGRLADLVLFGAFLAWAVADFAVARRRDRRAGTQYPAGMPGGDVVTLIAGTLAWAVFAFYLHGWLIGVRPF
ncbi:MAG: NnrU family protein [Burkholderiales bacterium]|nr:NnrU family protein [Burkholderiales bacterium]ODU62461.1 MAG: NnrU family protein [Lautropia sp. SCN 66-9]